MRYLAFAADYDGTLAHHGRVDEPTVAALRRLKESGRKLLMVTGRILPELMENFPHLDLFERVVVENGALLYTPATKEERTLVEPPPEDFAARLRGRGVDPVQTGRVIVATWEPFQKAVLDTIQELSLELQIIFNKGAVMVLPSGVNKAFGLKAALKDLGLSPHNCVGIGDAENDHAFLTLCECSVAVANALVAVKERADIVTRGDHGAGAAEVIDRILANDLADVRLERHYIPLGRTDDGRDLALEPYGINVMVAGSSGSGKSTMTTGVIERLQNVGYQYVIIDPEGDYSTLEHSVMLGDPKRPPLVNEVLDLLATPGPPIVVNLLGVALEHRPPFFDSLLPRLQEFRGRTGRPRWIVVDEAHHLLHSSYAPAQELPKQLEGMLYITVHPESVARAIVETVDVLIAIGETPAETIANFCKATGRTPPKVDPSPLPAGSAIVWRPKTNEPPVRIKTIAPKSERRRHSRKYAEGNLGPDNSFYFRGPEGKLNLKAHNLAMFLQIADGVDDATWEYHLRKNDYVTWFRDMIKDPALADAAAAVAKEKRTPAESRSRIREEVQNRYTLPADQASGVQETGSSSGK